MQSLSRASRSAPTVSSRLPSPASPAPRLPRLKTAPHTAVRGHLVSQALQPRWPSPARQGLLLPVLPLGPGLPFPSFPQVRELSGPPPPALRSDRPTAGPGAAPSGGRPVPPARHVVSVPCVPPQKPPSDPAPGSPEWSRGPHRLPGVPCVSVLWSVKGGHHSPQWTGSRNSPGEGPPPSARHSPPSSGPAPEEQAPRPPSHL